jgi:hypothetical protein
LKLHVDVLQSAFKDTEYSGLCGKLYDSALKTIQGIELAETEFIVKTADFLQAGKQYKQALALDMKSGMYVRLMCARTGKKELPMIEAGKMIALESTISGQRAIRIWK